MQVLDPSLLPPDNVLAMIAKFEQAQSPEEVDELVALLADWLERVGEPNLVERFRAWITLVVAQRFGSAGLELELKLRKEEEGKMTTLIERSRKWGEELNRQWLEKGISVAGLRGSGSWCSGWPSEGSAKTPPGSLSRFLKRSPIRSASRPSRTRSSNARRPRSSWRGRGGGGGVIAVRVGVEA